MSNIKEKINVTFVVYNYETDVLITTIELENKMKKEWFKKGTGRNIKDYTRAEIEDSAVNVQLNFHYGNPASYISWAKK